MRTTLQRYAANTGKVDPRLTIRWPKRGAALWAVFRRLPRPQAFSGIAPISLQEILAYQTLYNVRFSRWELDILGMFDAIAIDIINTKTEAET